MYGVSEELPFAAFVGAECNMIALGRFQVQFHFDNKSINIEGKWELRDPVGNIIDRKVAHDQREAYRVHMIIDQRVCGFEVAVPVSFTLLFENGYALTIYDDTPQYESFSMHADSRAYYI
jgi:hypothetical protein